MNATKPLYYAIYSGSGVTLVYNVYAIASVNVDAGDCVDVVDQSDTRALLLLCMGSMSTLNRQVARHTILPRVLLAFLKLVPLPVVFCMPFSQECNNGATVGFSTAPSQN